MTLRQNLLAYIVMQAKEAMGRVEGEAGIVEVDQLVSALPQAAGGRTVASVAPATGSELSLELRMYFDDGLVVPYVAVRAAHTVRAILAWTLPTSPSGV